MRWARESLRHAVDVNHEEERGWSWRVELELARSEIQELEEQLQPLREYETFCLLALRTEKTDSDHTD